MTVYIIVHEINLCPAQTLLENRAVVKTINHGDNDGRTGQSLILCDKNWGYLCPEAEHPPLEKFKRYTF